MIALGGAGGAVSRYLVSLPLPGVSGTLAVNVAGSFLLGVVLYGTVVADRYSKRTRFFVATGFLSSFTTYSTFALQTFESSLLVAVGNVAANYGLGFAAVMISRELVEGGRRIERRGGG